MSELRAIGLLVENANARDYVSQAQAAERMGFDTFWVPEDYAFPGAFSSCAAIAASTSRIKIGTCVVNPFTRHPVLIAMELAALDQISAGRAILGLGASIRLWIEEQMAIRYDRPLAALRDAVAIIRGLFAGGPMEHRGKVFSAGAGIRFNLRPPRAEVPIYLGATSPRAIELAGEIADGWLPFGFGPQAIARGIERVRAGANRSGRALADFPFCSLIFTAVADDDRKARASIKPFIATMLGWFANQPELPIFTDHGIGPQEVNVVRQSFVRGEIRPDMVSEAMIDAMTLAGNPERCRERLAALLDAGMTHPIFAIGGGANFQSGLERLYRDVIRSFI
ncbi:MAG TPA: LLM class flavin-dependent oxidoreductase [Candidatus Binataceae bacterium]|nr:LLM class flavin-dependent oxidoreductase [Candidatus Binataceae bacterium]